MIICKLGFFLSDADKRAILHPNAEPIEASHDGKLFWELDFDSVSKAPVLGTIVKKDAIVAYIQTPHGMEALKALDNGKIVNVCCEQGGVIAKGQPVAWVESVQVEEEKKAKKAPGKPDTEVLEHESKWKNRPRGI